MPEYTPQHELNDFLQTELYHTLGSYGTAAERLRAQIKRIEDAKHPSDGAAPAESVARRRAQLEQLFPSHVLQQTLRLNDNLYTLAHRPGSGLHQHPSPRESDEVRRRRKDDEEWEARERKRLNGVVANFYATAIDALDAYAKLQGQADGSISPRTEPAKLGEKLALIHDPQRQGDEPIEPASAEMRRERNKHRRDKAYVLTALKGTKNSSALLGECIDRPEESQLHKDAIAALVQAHRCMHYAEHRMSVSFGGKVRGSVKIDEDVRSNLERSVMLNTFVYVVGRTVPWIFAEDETERDVVIDSYRECCKTLSPTYCMWIGNQISLLALHRRAYTYQLLGKPAKAYNDFHKLRRFTRNLERQLDERVSEAPGARAFLDGLAAFADHHSGRIYREQHAHTAALRHFDRAATRLARLEQDHELRDMLRNSRWRIDLLVSQAKADYELGHVKSSLLCYARAWHAFLELADTEGRARANFGVIDAVIEWLVEIEGDTDLDKVELKERFLPLVGQFETVHSPTHLHALAADIMMRIGHLLFILRLPKVRGHEIHRAPGGHPVVDHELAYRSLAHAALLDRSNTLIAADLLKVEHWVKDTVNVDALDLAHLRKPPAVDPIDVQQPGGSGPFEETARVVEYILQSWALRTHPEKSDEGEAIARQLLLSLLTHTDSTNVKLAQVFRYMMQGSTDDGRPEQAGVELICLRRYSSFFPFLPRPSAFHVLGGGYFVRVIDPNAEIKRFGVVVDPGPNFIDNLYRCGYCLDDIHMIVVTHDHADHLAALDAMLSLLGYRGGMYGAKTFGRDRKLVIVGNRSVYDRYSFFNSRGGRRARARPRDEMRRERNVHVETFEGWARKRSQRGLLTCPSLRIERVATTRHRDTAGNLAQGFLLTAGSDAQRSCIFFTSDTGRADDIAADGSVIEGVARDRQLPFSTAVERADVVVAHLSSVPLKELRTLARLDRPPAEVRDDLDEFQRLWTTLRDQIGESRDDDWKRRREFLLRQLQFGFYAQPRDGTPAADRLAVSPLSPLKQIKAPSPRHLYLAGLLPIAQRMNGLRDRRRLLLIGELREDLGTFRTRVASAINEYVFGRKTADDTPTASALTTDIGLKIRLQAGSTEVLCATCALDNDLIDAERYHPPSSIREVCVKGEDEGIFHNCPIHEPQLMARPTWVERVERYDPFGP